MNIKLKRFEVNNIPYDKIHTMTRPIHEWCIEQGYRGIHRLKYLYFNNVEYVINIHRDYIFLEENTVLPRTIIVISSSHDHLRCMSWVVRCPNLFYADKDSFRLADFMHNIRRFII